MKVLQFNHSDSSGGAARAAYRIHQSILNAGIDSSLLVNFKSINDSTIFSPNSFCHKFNSRVSPYFSRALCRLLLTNNTTLHSPSFFPSAWPKLVNSSDADIIHLHWVQGEMLSVRDISLIAKPTIWTLHDMWPFCGAEHYTTDLLRVSEGYLPVNRPVYESGFDLNRWVWKRKLKYWKKSIHIVSPSNWLADSASQSYLMHDWPITVIPNPIDTQWWHPLDKVLSRKDIGISNDKLVILFGAIDGGRDYRKGFDLLLSALSQLKPYFNANDLQLLVIGQNEPNSLPTLGFPVHYLGHINNDFQLRKVYSSADLMVIPSRQDNLPNTGLEAHACGVPIVAFNTGGLSDIVDDHVTGVLAQPFDAGSLAKSICSVLKDLDRLSAMSIAARRRALNIWSPSRVASLYAELYCELAAN